MFRRESPPYFSQHSCERFEEHTTDSDDAERVGHFTNVCFCQRPGAVIVHKRRWLLTLI